MKRYENEGAFRQAGVRDVKGGRVQDKVTVEKDVEIECAGTVTNPGGTIAAKVVLDAEKRGKERGRRKVGNETDDGVEEARLIGKSNRRCGVKGGAAAHVANGTETLDGGSQSGIWRACRAGNVCAHPDVGCLHAFRVARGEKTWP